MDATAAMQLTQPLHKALIERPEATALVYRQRRTRFGWLDNDGLVYVVDRIKDMIVTGGENVYSAEVENAITELPAVSMVAVIGVPDERWGERVHAVVVLRAGHSLSAEDLVAHCRAQIAGYKCPRSVEFRTELPLPAAGKVLKYELRAPFWAGRSRHVN